jgi:hypothetical protein
MATAEGLMNVGFPAEQAKRTGVSIVSITTTAVGQGSAGGQLVGPGNLTVLANVAGAGHAVTLPTNADLGDEVEIMNTSAANAGVVFPATGGTINGGSANASMTLAAQAALPAPVVSPVHLRKISATGWRQI